MSTWNKIGTWAVLASLFWGVLTSPEASAWPFGKKAKEKEAAAEQVRTFQPPPEDAVKRYCEPIRLEAVEISKKPRLIRPLFAPRKAQVIRKHQKCVTNLMRQEYQYLKHVDIQQSPSLPKLKTDAPDLKPPVVSAPEAVPAETVDGDSPDE